MITEAMSFRYQPDATTRCIGVISIQRENGKFSSKAKKNPIIRG